MKHQSQDLQRSLKNCDGNLKKGNEVEGGRFFKCNKMISLQNSDFEEDGAWIVGLVMLFSSVQVTVRGTVKIVVFIRLKSKIFLISIGL